MLSTDGGAYGSGGGAERRGGFGGFNDVATLSTVSPRHFARHIYISCQATVLGLFRVLLLMYFSSERNTMLACTVKPLFLFFFF